MGKKAKMKLIRRIAMQLPELHEKAQQSEKVDGSTLWKEGVKEVSGKPIELNTTYRRVTQVSKPVNRTRKMKAMYNKHGIKGIYGYAHVITEYIKEQAEKNPDASN